MIEIKFEIPGGLFAGVHTGLLQRRAENSFVEDPKLAEEFLLACETVLLLGIGYRVRLGAVIHGAITGEIYRVQESGNLEVVDLSNLDPDMIQAAVVERMNG
ncbi:hypothetical protein HZA40_03195 [Candidatus Peregrinibacteria bacterium]|nr:hypothetical protein [Candidatus Peregrinibacteria bacterium]